MNALTAARQAAEAAYTAHRTPANLAALQAAGAAEMDAVLTAFDTRNAPAETITEAPRSTRRSRRNAQFDRMQAEIDSRPIVPITPEMESEYVRYISDGLADTDGHFAPVDRQSFFCINF